MPKDRHKNRDAAYWRQYNEANRERRREVTRKWHAANRDKINEGNRRRYRLNPQRGSAAAEARRHGRDIAQALMAMWQAQGGRCYLCEEPLPAERRKVHVDHAHTCCGPKRSCGFCRRGLACDRCNNLIGRAGDDPELLRRIAGNLERILQPVRDRIAQKPVQEALLP